MRDRIERAVWRLLVVLLVHSLDDRHRFACDGRNCPLWQTAPSDRDVPCV